MRKLKSISLGFLIVLALFSVTNTVTAENENRLDGYDHKINPWDPASLIFPADTPTHIRLGWYTTQEEFKAGYKVPPRMYLYIDEEEVNVQRYAIKGDDPDMHGPLYVFYATFDAYTFSEGEHHGLIVFDNKKNIYMDMQFDFYVEPAGTPEAPHKNLEGYDHRIIFWDPATFFFSEDQTTYMLYEWATTIEEFEAGLHKIPSLYVYIDGVEVEDIFKFVEPKDDPAIWHSPSFFYYCKFDAYFFEPGEHEVKIAADNGLNYYAEFFHPIFVSPVGAV